MQRGWRAFAWTSRRVWSGPDAARLGPAARPAGAEEDWLPTSAAPMWDRDGVHEIFQAWRRLLGGYGVPDRILCAEAWVHPPERAALYVRRNEFHQAFNFRFPRLPVARPGLSRRVITRSLECATPVGAPATWVLKHHDVVRHATRLALPVGRRHDRNRGRRPATGPGTRPAPSPCRNDDDARSDGIGIPLSGEELGLPEATSLPDELGRTRSISRTRQAAVGP